MNIEKEKVRLNAMLEKVQKRIEPLLKKQQILTAQIALLKEHENGEE